MATQSPFSFLEGFLKQLQPASSTASTPQRPSLNIPDFLTPPGWARDEALRRLVLLLNHVLMQEPEAIARLTRQKGRVVRVNWRQFDLKLLVTPAGLLDVASAETTSDLTLALTQTSPVDIALAVLRGDKPAVRIEGDVQLAAEINWLTDHVRWDIEDDLSRVFGDVPARSITQATGWLVDAVRKFAAVGPKSTNGPSGPNASAPVDVHASPSP